MHERCPRLLKLLFPAATLMLLATGSLAQEPAAADDKGVRCSATGYDVVIFNDRAEPLATGTEIEWSVPFLRKEGAYVLTQDLDPAASAFVSAALGSTYLVGEKPCAAYVRFD